MPREHNSKRGEYHILIVVRWPLGGIRTYMRYMFNHFPASFKLTILAASTQEAKALADDAAHYRARLILISANKLTDFAWNIFLELARKDYDCIISQGFVSAEVTFLANFMARLPHIVTIHGIVEPQLLSGRFSRIKRIVFQKSLAHATVLYGVSHDILEHVYDEFPVLRSSGPQSLVIMNGVELSDYDKLPEKLLDVRETLGIAKEVFLFGFFGRFMPQKGFDLLIEAMALLCRRNPEFSFAVVAVGAGDYLREYQAVIRDKKLEPLFYFLPFQPRVHHLYAQMDCVVMPSRWEACSLLAMEVLCTGTPLIASDCLGLRETVANTPTLVFSAENSMQLAYIMNSCLHELPRQSFQEFRTEARSRFDVARSAEMLVDFLQKLLNS